VDLEVGTNVSEEHTVSVFRDDEEGNKIIAPTSPHGVTSNKFYIDIFIEVRTSDLVNTNTNVFYFSLIFSLYVTSVLFIYLLFI
jgi:hypothetical protein